MRIKDDNKVILASNPKNETLASNTGYDSQPAFECGVDWLDFTFRTIKNQTEVEKILSEVEKLTGDIIDFSFTKPVFNGRLWNGSGRGTRGVLVWYDQGEIDDKGNRQKSEQLKFSFSGRVMSAVDFSDLMHWLISRAGRNSLDCTRIDICVDDKKRLVSLGKITQAMKAGNFFNATYRGLQLSGNRGENDGVTIYFGHPSSHKRLRIYDKFAESKGQVEGIRWEGQFRKAVASEILFTLLEKFDDSLTAATDYFKCVVTGLIDFRDRTGDDPNRARCPVLPWFREFCDALKACPIKISIALKPPLVQRSIDWLTKSVAQSLSVVKKVLQDDWQQFIETTITEGGERLNNNKRRLISITNRDDLIYGT